MLVLVTSATAVQAVKDVKKAGKGVKTAVKELKKDAKDVKKAGKGVKTAVKELKKDAKDVKKAGKGVKTAVKELKKDAKDVKKAGKKVKTAPVEILQSTLKEEKPEISLVKKSPAKIKWLNIPDVFDKSGIYGISNISEIIFKLIETESESNDKSIMLADATTLEESVREFYKYRARLEFMVRPCQELYTDKKLSEERYNLGVYNTENRYLGQNFKFDQEPFESYLQEVKTEPKRRQYDVSDMENFYSVLDTLKARIQGMIKNLIGRKESGAVKNELKTDFDILAKQAKLLQCIVEETTYSKTNIEGYSKESKSYSNEFKIYSKILEDGNFVKKSHLKNCDALKNKQLKDGGTAD
jgi:hypothetical protein